MNETKWYRDFNLADLRVRGGAPLVEPKAHTAEAHLRRVVADLHTRTSRSSPPAPLRSARSRQDGHGGGISPCTPAANTMGHGRVMAPSLTRGRRCWVATRIAVAAFGLPYARSSA